MSIELKKVSKQFGNVAAVSNVSFSVNEGELLALLGPSGGGKTTVLRMIAGLEMPTDGDIYVRGQRVNDLSVQQRNIGFVFQNYALFKNMNVFKNIAFGLKVKKWKRADIKARVYEFSSCSDSRNSNAVTRTSSRAVNASGWPLPARSRPSRVCSCSTNRLAPWTRRSGRNSANGSSPCTTN